MLFSHKSSIPPSETRRANIIITFSRSVSAGWKHFRGMTHTFLKSLCHAQRAQNWHAEFFLWKLEITQIWEKRWSCMLDMTGHDSSHANNTPWPATDARTRNRKQISHGAMSGIIAHGMTHDSRYFLMVHLKAWPVPVVLRRCHRWFSIVALGCPLVGLGLGLTDSGTPSGQLLTSRRFERARAFSIYYR